MRWGTPCCYQQQSLWRKNNSSFVELGISRPLGRRGCQDDIVCSFQYDNEPYQYKKFNFLFGNTAYGDGQYSDNQGNSCYSVDSGTIGIINLPTKKLKQQAKELVQQGSANIVKFDQPFSVQCEDGTFFFGHIMIDTDYSEDEDYEDD